MRYSDLIPNPEHLIPFANWNGKYDSGIGGQCVYVLNPTTEFQETVVYSPGTDKPMPENPEEDPDNWHCLEVDWPAKSLLRSFDRRTSWTGPVSWMGSLIQHGRDPSGQYYRRNRFYDAASGRFTQEDPIGLAGGLNVYGYANGDPVSFADPYGLSATQSCPPNCDETDAAWAAVGATVGAFFGGGGGVVLGLGCGPGAPACSLAGGISGGLKGAAMGAAAGVATSNLVRAAGNLFARDGDASAGGEGESQGSSAGRMQRQVRRGQAPRSVKRVDRGRSYREQDNVHFNDGKHALNRDGTWKHGGRDLTNAESEWLKSHGWGTP